MCTVGVNLADGELRLHGYISSTESARVTSSTPRTSKAPTTRTPGSSTRRRTIPNSAGAWRSSLTRRRLSGMSFDDTEGDRKSVAGRLSAVRSRLSLMSIPATRQGDVVQRHGDVGGQDVDEGRLVPDGFPLAMMWPGSCPHTGSCCTAARNRAGSGTDTCSATGRRDTCPAGCWPWPSLPVVRRRRRRRRCCRRSTGSACAGAATTSPASRTPAAAVVSPASCDHRLTRPVCSRRASPGSRRDRRLDHRHRDRRPRG